MVFYCWYWISNIKWKRKRWRLFMQPWIAKDNVASTLHDWEFAHPGFSAFNGLGHHVCRHNSGRQNRTHSLSGDDPTFWWCGSSPPSEDNTESASMDVLFSDEIHWSESLAVKWWWLPWSSGYFTNRTLASWITCWIRIRVIAGLIQRVFKCFRWPASCNFRVAAVGYDIVRIAFVFAIHLIVMPISSFK